MHTMRFSRQAGVGLAVGLIATFLPVIYLEAIVHRLNGTFIYPVDDTFIHMQIAKNLAWFGNWGINSHEFASASSSLLYTIILAFCARVFSVNMVLPLVINSVAAVILLYTVSRWLARQQLTTTSHVLVILAIVFFTPLPIMVISGMEHTIQCLLTFMFLFRGADWMASNRQSGIKNWKLPWSIPVFALLVTSIRYEGLFLVAVFCLLLFYFRQWGPAVKVGMAALIPVVVFGLFSLSKGSYFLPNSVLIKGAEASIFGGGISHFFNTLLVDKLTLMKPGITLQATQRLLLLLPVVYLVFHKQNRMLLSHRIILVILIAVTFLHLAFAATGKFYRYEAYLVFCAALITSTILCRCGSELYMSARLVPKVMAFIVFFFLALPLVLRSTAAITKAKQACINIYEQQYQMAGFLSEYYPADTIAANDIGAVSFFTHGAVIDLWGLGNIEVARSRKHQYWNDHFLDSFARQKHTSMAVIYDSWFTPSPGIHWTKVGTWQISNNVVCGDDLVSFYAIDSSKAGDIRKNFRTYSEEKLPRTVMVKYY